MSNDVSVSAAAVLGALVLLRWGFIFVGALLLLRPARSCPACFRRTLRIRRPVLTALLPRAEWRWCPSCRWQGPARREPREDEWMPTSSESWT